MLARVKKNDLVFVSSGRDRGKEGHVISVDNKKERVLIKGIGLVTKHLKARRQGEKSRIAKEESYLPLSKVMPVCPACKKSCRIRIKFLEDGKKTRVCHRCNEAF